MLINANINNLYFLIPDSDLYVTFDKNTRLKSFMHEIYLLTSGAHQINCRGNVIFRDFLWTVNLFAQTWRNLLSSSWVGRLYNFMLSGCFIYVYPIFGWVDFLFFFLISVQPPTSFEAWFCICSFWEHLLAQTSETSSSFDVMICRKPTLIPLRVNQLHIGPPQFNSF